MHAVPGSGRARRSLWVALSVLMVSVAAHAGGTPEHALVIIDPSDRDALRVGHYYVQARDIPASNVLYIAPGAANYAEFADANLDALFGHLGNSRTEGDIDFIVIAPTTSFYVPASGLVSDDCSPVNRFSISGAYSLAFVSAEVAGRNSTWVNRFYSTSDSPMAFDSATLWQNGQPSTNTGARQYFIGAMLGYTGSLGNTVDELITMIDRSVAVDGTRPAGTFYYMKTTDTLRSGPRDGLFGAAVGAITALGGSAFQLLAVLPTGQHNILGIMTGWADPGIATADMTILPGAFCDHLTSWAATFDIASQEKVSRWIGKGASGSWGAVEEPCNYAGKFPSPDIHTWYYQGVSLGEACFRSIRYAPFQGLMYGDPLTRPFAHQPAVSVPDAPSGTVSGTIILTPQATTTHPTAAIAGYDLLVDGVLVGSINAGGAFSLATFALSDGWHDLRVLAYDDTSVKSTGRWLGELVVNNTGRSASIQASPPSGDRNTAFTFDVGAVGPNLREVRVVQNGRVLAAAPSASAQLVVHGRIFDAGTHDVQAEALFVDGRVTRSPPISITVNNVGGSPSAALPVAYSFRKRVRADRPFVVELPATLADPTSPFTFVTLSSPAQASMVPGSGPYRIMTPNPGATGEDTFIFRAHSAPGQSNEATVTIEYSFCRSDLDGDGITNAQDLALLLSAWGMGAGGDLDGDAQTGPQDLALLLSNWNQTCP